ncbi:acyltransferase [Rhodococcus sp. ACPA4]|uniref:acyltransferase family protein n=1 Tax=Rhodococcus sp. ACPA4 TaxID=2028571 RepID=UPI000BB13C29|nr:acyltransferase family protein [Rhodococcus sp. ACPA4]PBC44481.1 acyltransferase [Rhodococcus sp. ACPA4]
MVTALLPNKKRGRQHKSGAKANPRQRLDIQGLRMVAVMLVVLSHLFGWPQGGFIGVDVFFVISGFLITGSLMHTVEKTGRISFSSFYRRRVRRIIPAATLVLVVTVAAAYFIYTGSRFKSTVLDSVAAFFFVSNWRFGIEGTDYFTASGPVSPLQHYWSLSVEEQFYFVWPAVIFVIAVVAARMAWTGRAWIALAGGVMGVVVAVSFVYSFLDTASDPTWAYFSTLTRVWELGVGALLAITITSFERIPDQLRPFIAWAGLIMIGVGAFAITETGGGFPAPWAVVPVLGAALIICAGVRGEQKYLQVLTNRASTYIGDISYSLYLWHWPVIILLAALMDSGTYYYVAALFLMFGFSIAAYHFFENPIRASKWLETGAEQKERSILDVSRWRLPTLKVSERNQTIGIGALALVTFGVAAIALVPATASTATSVAYSSQTEAADAAAPRGPAQDALAAEIATAVAAASWPELAPSLDEVASRTRSGAAGLIGDCASLKAPGIEQCTFGNSNAPQTIVVVGDSTAMMFSESFRNIAESSNGQWKVQLLAMSGCAFADRDFTAPNAAIEEACPKHVADVVTHVQAVKPDVVVVSNDFVTRKDLATKAVVSVRDWGQSEESVLKQISDSAGEIVLLTPPPIGGNIRECYTKQSSPSNCVTKVGDAWASTLTETGAVAQRNGWVHVDTLPLYCTPNRLCPSFVGEVPTKADHVHMTIEYANKIVPALREQFADSGVPL